MNDDRHPGEDALITLGLAELDEPERGRVLDHLEACPECRSAADSIRLILDQAQAAREPAPDSVLVDLLLARSRRRRGLAAFFAAPQLAAAALFVAAFFVAGFWTGRTTGAVTPRSMSARVLTGSLTTLPAPEFRAVPALDLQFVSRPDVEWVRNGGDSTAGDSL